MLEPDVEDASDGGLATVRWLRDPGDDVSCGPLPCDIGSLHDLLHETPFGQVAEVAVRGVVLTATRGKDGWQMALSSESKVGDQLLLLTSPTVTSAARRPGSTVRASGVLELTSRFEVRLRADEIVIVETSSPDG